jgi:hypothetical protein
VAPVAGALLLRFLGAAAAAAALLALVAVVSAFWATSAGWAVVDGETAMVGCNKRGGVIAVLYNVASAGCGSCIVGVETE